MDTYIIFIIHHINMNFNQLVPNILMWVPVTNIFAVT